MKREHLTILLVDDDPNDLLLIEMAFRAAGVEDPIRTVPSGTEAIAYLKGEGKYEDRSTYEFPSFILTDLRMTQGDGFAVLEALRGNPVWSILPTAVLSASSDEDDIKHAYLLGANSYLVKPGDQERLAEILKTFHHYWTMVEVPRVDARGEMLETKSQGKMGARFC